jgi:hypothetical protein
VFPDQTPQSVKVVGAHSTHRTRNRRADITLEYQFPSKWTFVSVRTLNVDGTTTMLEFHVEAMENPLEQRDRFTLTGKISD